MTISTQRTQIRRLLDDASAADAPTAYYALFHDPTRSKLVTCVDGSGQVTGFAGAFQTGIDLFRPVVTMCCPDASCAADVLHRVLTVGRPYILFARSDQLALAGGSLRIDHQRTLHIYRLETRHFQPVLNVLVRQKHTPDGLPRSVIESGEQQAVAGVNWQSPAFAEIFVETAPAARQRGWGISVASALSQAILASGRVPLYLVDADNDASHGLAEKLGYVDTGAQQVYADVVYLGHPGK